MDQNHEQVNKELKSGGGISGLLNTTGSLERFLISALEFQSNFKDFDTLNHHSESKALQKRFIEDCEAVTKKILEFGNPFSEHTEITSLYSKRVSGCSEKIDEIEELGESQFKNYVQTVFLYKTKSICDPVKMNKIEFFKKATPKDKREALKKKSFDSLTNLFITAQQRNLSEVNELLKYEIDLPPPALIKPKTGDVKSGTKSKLID